MQSTNKLFGTIFIVAGTTIGASMLALPLVSKHVGLGGTFCLMGISWLFMLANAYTILRMMTPYPAQATFRSIAEDTLGPWAKHAITGAMVFLFYALLAAYGSSASQLLLSYIPLGHSTIATLLFLFLGGLILWNTTLTDYLNRIFFVSLLVFLFGALMPLWDIMPPLSAAMEAPHFTQKTLLSALLVYITSFGFHGSIASLWTYAQRNESLLKRAFFWGTLLAVCLYVTWVFMSASVLDAPNLEGVSGVIAHIALKTGKPWVGSFLNLFALVAILTSFIGVGMGLSNDFKNLPFKNPGAQKIAQGAFTFVPPFLILQFNPSIFVQALEYAGVALMFLAVLMPNLMVLSLVKQERLARSLSQRLISYTMIGSALVLIPLYFIFG